MEVIDAETGESLVLNTKSGIAPIQTLKRELKLPSNEEFKAMDSIAKLKESHEKQILTLLEVERHREQQRQTILKNEKVFARRKQLEKKFRLERARAQEHIDSFRFDLELSLVHKMGKAGVLR